MYELQEVKAAIDGTLGVAGVTSPFWLQMVQNGMTLTMAIGGVILLILRIAIAWREWRQGRNK